MYTLRRWLDPDFSREESERERHHEQVPAPVPGGDGPRPYRVPRTPRRRRCHLCGREEWDTAYCTECLAESMEEIPR